MAEGIVTDLVLKALEAMGKIAVEEAVSWWGARDDLEQLKATMRLVKARVSDAEVRQEADGGEAIKEWLRRLKLVLYQVDDLFDEVLTRDCQKKRMESKMFGKVGILFSKFGPLYFNKKLADEIKSIRKQFDAIKSDMSGLNLRDIPAQQLPMARLIQKRETASIVNTEFVIPRDNDQNNILNILFDPNYDDQRVTVIPIVGFGGLGKTTIAQLIFKHEKVKKNFDLTKWAYVPEKDNLILIKKKIYKSFTDKSYNDLSLDQIERGIIESIKDKKYFLVLDDVWDDKGDRLFELISLLKHGNQGSKVIITTRLNAVADAVGTIHKPYMLGTLTDDQSWDLFTMFAFKEGKEDNNHTFTKIGKEIVSMCGNVPLAIKVVGGFLRTKATEKEWLQARDAQRSKAQLTKGNPDIMDVLKLSYDYLPSALKQCFAYCSLFPKGCRFDREELVYMWMAQGYFESSNNEIDGDTLYMNMLARGFFQDPEFSDDGNVENCRMHDLLHDLTQLLAGEESMVLHDDEPSIQVTHGLLHVKFNGYKSTAEACSSLFVGRRIRSLISTVEVGNKYLNDFISRMQHLRLLKIEKIYDKTLPDAIGGLMHLRYLYIQSDEIKYLPDSLTRLQNLQTLHVQDCRWLKELPSAFAKLTNINHLLLPGTILSWSELPPWSELPSWSELPRGFGKLTSLQVLNRFIVGENNGIDSLPVLNYRGKLTIKFKKWRKNCIVEAQRANLKNCAELTSLQLLFYGMGTFSIEEMNEMLMNLELPPNLRHLEVRGYQGEKMPSRWFDGLSKVVSMGGENLEMEEETKEVDGNNSRMRHREWQGLTSLRKLTLTSIPKMKKLPTGITSLTTLDMLQIRHLNNLIKLPEEFGNLSMLRELDIWDCPKLKSFPTSLQGLTSLKRLAIGKCPELKSLPTSLLSHISLKWLDIINCPNLEERYKRPDGEDCHLIQHIPDVNMGWIV